MRKLKARSLAIPAFIFAVCTTFQNCDAGFHFDPSTQELSSSSVDITGVFGLKLYIAGTTSPLSDATPIVATNAYTIRATGDTVSTALLSFSMNQASTAQCSISAVGVLTQRSLSCSSAGTVIIDLKAVWPDSTISAVSMTKVVQSQATSTPPPSNDPNVVTFRVRAGTSASPWNTSADPIRVFVGQTLRVYNDDTISHQIHAAGSPFPHEGNAIPPNGADSISVTATHSGTSGDLYDHISGTSSVIYIESISGDEQYRKVTGPGSCAGCHGNNAATSSKRGTSLTSLKNAIANQGQMRGMVFTDRELLSIVYVLNK